MTLAEHLSRCARDYLLQTVKDAGGNMAKAARMAGCNRTHLFKLLERYEVDISAIHRPYKDRFRPGAWNRPIPSISDDQRP
jgi:DNA-binding NtrC family response regulator